MKTLLFNIHSFEAEKIVKTDQSIIGYDISGNEIFSFRGISDFSLFQLTDGETFDMSEEIKSDLDIAELYESLSNESLQNTLAIAELYELITKGGA